eukprot:6358682-Pyramimonas_sp.AAC.1
MATRPRTTRLPTRGLASCFEPAPKRAHPLTIHKSVYLCFQIIGILKTNAHLYASSPVKDMHEESDNGEPPGDDQPPEEPPQPPGPAAEGGQGGRE